MSINSSSHLLQPSPDAWRAWANSVETRAFLQVLEQRDAELCVRAKQAAKAKQSTEEFLLRAVVFQEIADEIRSKA